MSGVCNHSNPCRSSLPFILLSGGIVACFPLFGGIVACRSPYIYACVARESCFGSAPPRHRRAAGASDRTSPGRPVSASTPTPHRWRPRAACRPARSRRAIWRSKAACPRRPQSGGAPVCHRIQTGTAVPACTSSVMCVWYRSITGKFMNLKDSFGGISSWC